MARDRPCLRSRTNILVLLAVSSLQLVSSQGLRTGTIMPDRPKPRVAHFNLEVSLARGSPACGPSRAVILINGLFQPTLYAHVNDTLQITITNKLPTSLPTTSTGISVHWHGFSMWDSAAWSDGTAYVTQCPLTSGTTYTYSFLADEAPGTYFWHDHSAMNRANGLQGVLVLGLPLVKPPVDVPYHYDGEHVLFVTDWFDQEANMMAMQLNRPTDINKVTNDSGTAIRIRNANALLINGKGNANDCQANGNSSSSFMTCNVAAMTVPAGNGNAGCTHQTFVVQAKKTYLFRLINGGTQQFVTVCFENHTVELVAADGTPMDSPVMENGCVDINTGQRYDVSLTTDQPVGLYWISVRQQYAPGAPAAYAVLKYSGVGMDQSLPSSPLPQPEDVKPWDTDVQALIQTSDFILGYNDNYDYEKYWNLFLHRAGYSEGVLHPDTAPGKLIVFNMTAPLMINGVSKWAVNNVAHDQVPPCSPLMDSLAADPNYLTTYTAPSDEQAQQNETLALLSVQTFNTSNPKPVIYQTDKGSPIKPVAGMHIVEVEYGAVVDVIINNLMSGDMNGDYRTNGTGGFTAQHPIHLHGHRFWVLGSGYGVYDDALNRDSLNWRAPILRDTATLPAGGWLYLRFKALNPGLWPMHCHILWHAYMGQSVVFAEAVKDMKKRPQPGPPCSKECRNSFAPYKRSWVAEAYNGSRFPLPS